MIAVMVDRPLSQNHIRFFRSEQPAESLIVCVVDNGPAIVLAGENGAGAETLASLPCFAGTDIGATIQTGSPTEPLPAIQVQQNNLMAEVGVKCDGPRAAAFRVAWMAARDDNLESGLLK
jgi:hypothetical protein